LSCSGLWRALQVISFYTPRFYSKTGVQVGEKGPVAPRCRYGLYDLCSFWFATGEYPGERDCVLCMKAFRLRHGLKTVIEARGTRSGITL